MNDIPSEKFLIFHRVITYLDEWGFYLILLYLYTNNEMTPFWWVLVIGGLFIIISYLRMWWMEYLKFGSSDDG